MTTMYAAYDENTGHPLPVKTQIVAEGDEPKVIAALQEQFPDSTPGLFDMLGDD